MNLIFISPQFPTNYFRFCRELNNNGVNVLGIGDSAYDALPYDLRRVLGEYYRVDSMESYDQMMRAVAYFTFKYGKVDWLESNNEYWMTQDARLRTDFHITSGLQLEEVQRLRAKSEMKKFYARANVPAVPCHMVEDEEGCLAFAETHGYPLVAKPDRGVGAANTYRLGSDEELRDFFAAYAHKEPYILEPYVNGTICSYDAVINSRGEAVFESGNVTPVSIMDIVNEKRDAYFYIEKELPEDVREAGRRCVEAFAIRSRFIHLEFFRLNADMAGIGQKGQLIGLEANLRPSGGYTPDMLNYANSTDVYKIWADMIAFDRSTLLDQYEHYYCMFIGRRDERPHVHSHTEVLSRYRADIMMSDRMPDVLAKAMGNQMYIAKFREKEQMDEFLSYVIA